jgi:hypothetical protein
MSKTLLYLAILAILGFGVWFFLFSDKSGTLFRSSDAAFTIRDTASVGKIFLSHNGTGKSVTLERKGDAWVVDGKHPALPSMVRSLLATLYLQEAKHPATEDIREGIIRNLAGAGIKVEVYNKNGDKMRSFYVGGELAGFTGTAMLMEGSERPYVVNIPGFEGYLTTRFTPELKYWKDRLVFDIAPEQITSVSVRYAQEPLNSFTLTQQNGKLSVALDPSLSLGKPLNEARTRSYLKFFTKVYAEASLMDIPELDSTLRVMPQKGTIDVQGTNGYHKTATIIYYPRTERDAAVNQNPTTFEEQFNPDRYFAVTNGGADTLSVPISSFEKIFRRGYEFYMADNNATEQTAVPGLPAGVGTQPK